MPQKPGEQLAAQGLGFFPQIRRAGSALNWLLLLVRSAEEDEPDHVERAEGATACQAGGSVVSWRRYQPGML